MTHTHFLLLLFLCFSISLNTLGQNYEWTLQDAPVSYSTIVEPLEDGRLLLGCDLKYSAIHTENVLYIIDSLGESYEKFFDIGLFEINNLSDILFVDKDNIYLSINETNCDVSGSTYFTIVKTNLTGETLWTNPGYPKLALFRDSLLVGIHYGFGNILNASGEFLSTFNIPFEPRGILPINDSTAFLYGENGFEFRTFNASDSESEAFTIDGLFVDAVQIENENFVLLKAEPLYSWSSPLENTKGLGLTLIDTTGNIIQHLDFQENESFNNIATYENKIYAFGKRDNLLLIKVFDQEMNPNSEFIIGQMNIIPKDLKQKNGKLYLTGEYIEQHGFNVNSSIPQEPRSTLWTKVVDVFELSNNERPDVGISNVLINEVIVDTNQCMFIQHSVRSCTLNNIELTLTNYGETPLNEVTLNSMLNHCSYFCNDHFYYKNTLTDLNLAPGSDTTFEIGSLGPTSLIVGIDSTYEFCFWTSAPNNKMDANPNNNGYCWVETNIPVGITEIDLAHHINIYPNPVQNRLFIELNDERLTNETSIEILNLHGQVVLSKTANNRLMNLDISSLNNGMYYVHLMKNKEMIYGEKLVKMGR